MSVVLCSDVPKLIFFVLMATIAAPAGASAQIPSQAPKWDQETSVTSDDGYADLSWSVEEGEFADIWELSESTPGQDQTHFYVDRPSIRVFRISPGRYDFRVRACTKNVQGPPDCGPQSPKLRIRITDNAIPAPNKWTPPQPKQATAGDFGGPDRLRPGGWVNPDKDAQGWYFYWANRLHHDESDPLFGNAYDLVGIWYTFEAKSVYFDDEVCHCNLYDDYLPVTAELRLVAQDEGSYTGGIWVTRKGQDIQIGSANLFFGNNNTSATINWFANFKYELIPGTSDVLVNIVSADPASTNNLSHYSGQWRSASDNHYFVDELITDSLEVINITFEDDAGDPVWIQATTTRLESTDVSFCSQYLNSGYRPDLVANNGSIYNYWYGHGCDASIDAGVTNRNGGRYFNGFESESLWNSFTLPGGTFNTGSVVIGTSQAPASLVKFANFHRIFYDPSAGNECNLLSGGSCTVSLTWFTDGDYPGATAWAYNQTTGVRSKVLTSTAPVMQDHAFTPTTAGNYVFELRMGDDPVDELIALSSEFVVADQAPGTPLPADALHGRWVQKSVPEFELAWRHSNPGSVAYFLVEETLPDGSMTQPLIQVNASSLPVASFNKSGEAQGRYMYRVRACNASTCSAYTPYLNWYTQDPAGLISIFEDDFETDQGWLTNRDGNDTATTGHWERFDPSPTSRSGVTYQQGITVSGSQDLVTQAQAGSSWGSYDIDRGVTSVTSPNFALPTDSGPILSRFHYYFAHSSTAGPGDFFRAYIEVAGQETLVLEELGDPAVDGGYWQEVGIDLTPWAGQTVRIRFEAADGADAGTIAEAGIDDISIILFEEGNTPPAVANPGSQASDQYQVIDSLSLAVNDEDDDILACSDGGTLPAGLAVLINPANDACIVSGIISAAAGTYPVTITVDDGNGGSAYAAFSWVVGGTVAPGSPETPPAPAAPPDMTPSMASSGAGFTEGLFHVDETGSATYSIPLLTAPGSGGLAPQMSLDYSSRSGNGPLGVGWSLGGLSAITRCPQTLEQDGMNGSIRMDANDRFCLDGQRLLLVNGIYGADGSEYRTEIDDISRIKAIGNAGGGPDSFTVERKDGSISEYGNTADSQVSVGSETLTWTQNRAEDRAGNYILYHYTGSASPAETVISQIEYTGNGSQQPYAALDFTWAAGRADATRTFIGGAELQQTRYLARIDSRARRDATSGYSSLRSYFLDYAADGLGRKSLQSVEECNNAARQVCFSPTVFTWLNGLPEISPTLGHNNLFQSNQVLYGLQVADVSGDGRPDILYTNKSGPNYKLQIESPDESGTFSSWGGSYTLPKKEDGSPPRIFGIDLDADGYHDIIYRKHIGNGGYQWAAMRSTGTGLSPEIVLSPFGFSVNEDQDGIEARVSVADFNGDGLGDVIYNKTSALGDQHDIDVALNTWSAGGSLGLSAPIEISRDFADLFPSPVGDGYGSLWETLDKPNFTDWNSTQLQGRNTPEARVFDFNGDGAVDMLIKVSREYRKCISNCPIEQTQSGPGETGTWPDAEYLFTDVAFWLLLVSTGNDTYEQQVVGVGSGCILQDPCNDAAGLPASDYMWPVDINADGHADLAYADNGNGWHYRLNTGDGFGAKLEITVTPSPLPGGQQELVRFEDLNGDGYPDLIYPSAEQDQSATWRVAYNRFGQFFDDPVATSLKAGNMSGSSNVENDASIFMDFTGDGKTDQFYLNLNTQGKPDDSDLYLGRNGLTGKTSSEPANFITAISNGVGATVQISYAPLTDPSVYTRMNDAGNADWGAGSAVYDLVAPVYVVSQVSASSPTFSSANATRTVEYHYAGAKIQGGGRGFLGFGEVISFDPGTGIRTNTRYRQDFPFTGLRADSARFLVESGQKFDSLSQPGAANPVAWRPVNAASSAPGSTGTLLSYAVNAWNALPTSGGAMFPYISSSLERLYTLEGDFDRKVLTNNTFDAYGNLSGLAVDTYAEDGNSAFAMQTTTNNYTNDTVNWRLGLLTGSSVTEERVGQTSIVRQSAYAYAPVSGMLIQEVIEPNYENFTVTTDYTLDIFGNRTRTTVIGYGMDPRTSETDYDALGRFVVESRNSLGQTVLKVNDWDAYGNELESANIDGVLTFSATDHMGRPFARYSETGVWSKTTHSVTTSSCPAGAVIKTTIIGGGVPGRFECRDVLDRTIRYATQGFDGTFIYVDQFFDASGRIERVSEPYFAGATRYWNRSEYDAIDRLISLVSADGDDRIIEFDANPDISCTDAGVRVRQSTNGLGQVRVERLSALGETIEVFDHLCGKVSYEYDSAGNLIQLTGADNVAVTMSYDPSGRKISMSDPDKGDWQYAYNPLGELTRQLDGKSQAIDFNYDKLGRIIERLELSDVDGLEDIVVTVRNRETTAYIDSASAGLTGKGQPGLVTYREGLAGPVLHEKLFSHDEYGRVSFVDTFVDQAQVFTEQTTYDQFGRVFQQFDATGDSRGIRFHYNAQGYVDKIQEAREGVTGAIYQEIIAMDPRKNATHTRLGNGVDVFASREPQSGRLVNLGAYKGAVELQNVEYLFDAPGNLRQRHDLSGSADFRESYNYDDLNRLASVNLSVSGGVASETLALSYDESGNILYKSDVGAYQYNGVQPHAVSSAGGVSYSYDNNGNQTAGDGRTIEYTVFDKASRITRGSNEILFKYGIGNQRYKREDRPDSVLRKSTMYLGSVERIEQGGSVHFKRDLGGVAVANVHPGAATQDVVYLLKDHIGSIHTVLGETGLVSTTMHFDAFGQRQDIDWRTPLDAVLSGPLNDITTDGFTGHEQVDDVGVIHMNGRIYDAKLGRFLQADPIVQAPSNSQNLNRYSYVLNNPLSYTDPTGYFLKRLVRKWGRAIVATVASYYTFGWASNLSWVGTSSVAAGVATPGAYLASTVVGSAAAGFVSGAILTQSFTGAVKGAFFGALTGYVGARIRTGYRNWKYGRGDLWHVSYDATSGRFSGAFMQDSNSAGIDKLFVNGQATELDDAFRLGFDQLAGPEGFFLLHNPTHGLIADTVESFLGKVTNTSSISRQLAGVLTNNAHTVVNITAHSQGSIIVSNALRHVSSGALSTSTLVNFNGAAVGKFLHRRTSFGAGATAGQFNANFFDAVPNILGFATYNPLKLIGSMLASPLLLTPFSPHSNYIP